MSHYTTRNIEDRLQVEVPIFDHLAELKLKNIERESRILLGGAADSIAAHRASATFPRPIQTWIDIPTSADGQFIAYDYLTPVQGQTVLQFGGSGSHAIKFLLAGAREATLLSPSDGEIRVAKALAERSGVAERFKTVTGIGEDIPLPDQSFDRIYGGACLHHSDVRLSLPEIYRILRADGRAAFVEPIETPLYNLWVNKLRGTRFLQDGHGAIEDRPFTSEMILESSRQFKQTKLLRSGGPIRYGLVPVHRLIPQVPLPVSLTYLALKLERQLLSAIGADKFMGNLIILLRK